MREALKSGFYFEAVSVLHGYVEKEMRGLLHLSVSVKRQIPLNVGWDANEKLTFLSLAHVLYIIQEVDNDEYGILIGFNSLRNEIVHRFYQDKYDGVGYQISKTKLNSVLKRVLKLVEKISQRSEEHV